MKKHRFNYYWKNNLFNEVFGILTLAAVLFFYEKILLTVIILLTLALIALIKWKSRITLLVFVSGAILGPIAEIIAISFGLWRYAVADFYNILKQMMVEGDANKEKEPEDGSMVVVI